MTESTRDDVRSEMLAFAGFLAGLPRFVRRRMSVSEALTVVQQRLRQREPNLHAVLDRIFDAPSSPYRALFTHAGCTRDDAHALVKREGVEGALAIWRAQGVYLSFEEFKGLQPIVRGSLTLTPSPASFDNPRAGAYYSTTTGGTTGTGRRVRLDLEHFAALLPARIVVRHVQGLTGIPAASWSDLPPGGGLKGVLLQAAAGEDATHWYTARLHGRDGAAWRFRLATTATLTVARLSGARVRTPRYLPFDRAVELAHWAAAQVAQHGACTIHASVSRILRIALAAVEHGIDLRGTILRGGGEPPTDTKVTQIRASGATFHSSYAFSEVGTVGSSCLHPSECNDQHFMQEHLALVQAPRRVPGFDLEVPAFCFTSLLPSAPKLLFNVESDDYGTVSRRACGCRWEQLGFPVHLTGIRSFRKLTGEGVTLVGSDMEHILEAVLPSRFGGSALDYQFVEEEDAQGFTRLVLRVAPHLPVDDEGAVADCVLEALERTGAAGALARSAWRQAGTVRVRREAPAMTSRGKLLPLDIRGRRVEVGA